MPCIQIQLENSLTIIFNWHQNWFKLKTTHLMIIVIMQITCYNANPCLDSKIFNILFVYCQGIVQNWLFDLYLKSLGPKNLDQLQCQHLVLQKSFNYLLFHRKHHQHCICFPTPMFHQGLNVKIFTINNHIVEDTTTNHYIK